jgi:hypothetical protein
MRLLFLPVLVVLTIASASAAAQEQPSREDAFAAREALDSGARGGPYAPPAPRPPPEAWRMRSPRALGAGVVLGVAGSIALGIGIAQLESLQPRTCSAAPTSGTGFAGAFSQVGSASGCLLQVGLGGQLDRFGPSLVAAFGAVGLASGLVLGLVGGTPAKDPPPALPEVRVGAGSASLSWTF